MLLSAVSSVVATTATAKKMMMMTLVLIEVAGEPQNSNLQKP